MVGPQPRYIYGFFWKDSTIIVYSYQSTFITHPIDVPKTENAGTSKDAEIKRVGKGNTIVIIFTFRGKGGGCQLSLVIGFVKRKQ